MAMQMQLVGPGVSFACHAAADEDAGHFMTDPLLSPDADPLEQAFENSHDCIALVDMQGRVLYMNLPGACLMGLDGRPPRQPVYWPELWSPEHRDLADYSIEEARCGHQCRFLACRRLANGLPRWWDVAVSPVFDAQGIPFRMLCVCRDVTTFKQAESSLQQQLAAKALLLAEASHRIKNHLTVIAAALALQARCSDNETVRASLRQAQCRIQAVASIHGRLQQGAGDEPLELSAELAQIARQAIAALGVEDHIAVTISCPQRLTMPTDRAVALLLITTELMTNALKHAYPEGRRGEVRITVDGTKRQLMLQVDDDGSGLPRDFDRHAGSGLGMRIVEGLVAQLRGELHIESRPPGAHFRVCLPMDESGTGDEPGSGTTELAWDAIKHTMEIRGMS